MEPAAEQNCSDLISRAVSLAPLDAEVQLTLASIRMSQSRVDEAKQVVEGVYERMREMEACESTGSYNRNTADPQSHYYYHHYLPVSLSLDSCSSIIFISQL